VKARLETYEERTRPLIEYYRSAKMLQTVDGSGKREEIYRDIEPRITAVNN
jgi:adenylate kinase